MTKMKGLENSTLDALADRVMHAFAEFDTRLDTRGRRFPVAEYDKLWRAVLEYSVVMQDIKWLHRDVAWEIAGLREYLQLDIFKVPLDALWKADQMECFLFSDYDAYPEHGKPPGFEEYMDQMETEFTGHEGECAGCEQFGSVNDVGLCEDCSQKLERDLVRNRDWAYSVMAYGASDRQREDIRKQIIDTFGEHLELIAPSRSRHFELNRKRRKRQKRK